jgi:hypothetical protein
MTIWRQFETDFLAVRKGLHSEDENLQVIAREAFGHYAAFVDTVAVLRAVEADNVENG